MHFCGVGWGGVSGAVICIWLDSAFGLACSLLCSMQAYTPLHHCEIAQQILSMAMALLNVEHVGVPDELSISVVKTESAWSGNCRGGPLVGSDHCDDNQSHLQRFLQRLIRGLLYSAVKILSPGPYLSKKSQPSHPKTSEYFTTVLSKVLNKNRHKYTYHMDNSKTNKANCRISTGDGFTS